MEDMWLIDCQCEQFGGSILAFVDGVDSQTGDGREISGRKPHFDENKKETD